MSDNIMCPKCGAHDVHYRRKRKDWICDECDHVWVRDEDSIHEKPKKFRIFLSYGHDTFAPQALRIKADLEKRGHEVWFDLERIKEGRDWEAYIEEGLKRCDKVVLLMTPYSVRRRNPVDPGSYDGYCLNEIALAIQRNKLIIPVLLVELPEGPPTSICRIQYLDLRDAVPIEEHEERYVTRFDRLIHAIEHDDLDFEGGQARLHNLLMPLNFDAEIKHHIARFTGRTWLKEEIDLWLYEKPDSRVFWLTGGPGIGKTAIATHLCHSHGDVVAYHLCIHGNEDKSDPRRALLSIAYQIAQHLPEYNQRLNTLDLEREVFKNTQTLFDNLVVQPLTSDFPVPDRPCLVIIDAIDEATREGQNEIATFIRDQWGKTPSWLRLMITSRPEAEIVTTLTNLNPYVFDARRAENLQDLRQYLVESLRQMGLKPADGSVEEILKRSEGVFLYGVVVLEEIALGRIDPDRPDDLPHGMAGYYQKFFERQFPDLLHFNHKIKPILENICASREPLSIAFLAASVGIGEIELRHRLSHLGSLFPIHTAASSEGLIATVTPFHKSLLDWLVGIDENTGYPLAGRHAIDVQAGQQNLADRCWREYRDGPTRMGRYAIRHLPSHLASLNRWEDLTELLTDFEFIESKVRESGPNPLIDDYDFVLQSENNASENLSGSMAESLRLIQGSLRLSSHILQNDASQLGSQLFGRLCHREEPEIQDFLDRVKASNQRPWLRPIVPSLTPPDEAGALIRTLTHVGYVPVAVMPDGKSILSKSFEGIYIWDLETGDEIYRVSDFGPHILVIDAAPTPDYQNVVFLLQTYEPETAKIGIWDHRDIKIIHTFTGHIDFFSRILVTHDGRHAILHIKEEEDYLKIIDLETGQEVQTLIGHTARIEAIALVPDGSCLVSGSADGTLKVWDLASGQELHTLSGHSKSVTTIAVTSDGRRAVSGSRDETVRIWDLERGCELRMLSGHTGGVTKMAITPDGRRVIAGSSTGSYQSILKIWDLTSGQELHTLSIFLGIKSMVCTPDSRYLITGSPIGTVTICDLETGREWHTLGHHTEDVLDIVVTSDGHRAVSGSLDTTLKIWDLQINSELQTSLDHYIMGVDKISVTPDGRQAFSVSSDGFLKAWDLETVRERGTLVEDADPVIVVVMSPDGCLAVARSRDETMKMYDLAKNGRQLDTLVDHVDKVNVVAVSPDGNLVVSGSRDETLKIWDREKGHEPPCTLAGYNRSIYSVAVTPDTTTAVTGSVDGTLKVWDLVNGREMQTLAGHTDWVSAVAVTPDGRRCISGSLDSTLKVWDLINEHEMHTLTGHTDRITSVVMTRDGLRAVSGSVDGTLRIWDLEDGRELHLLAGHTRGITAIALTSDERQVISGSNDTSLKVWDLESGRELHTLKGHTLGINTVAVTSDGRRIISGSDDTTLKVWNLMSGRELHTLKGHAKGICTVAVTSDDRRAISGSGETIIRVWDLESGLEIQTLEDGDEICTVAVTPDGQRVVVGSWYGQFNVHDLKSGEVLYWTVEHKGPVITIAVSTDGLRGVSGSRDESLRVWNLETGELLRTLTGRNNGSALFSENPFESVSNSLWIPRSISAIAMTPDSRHLISGFDDGFLKVWDLKTREEKAILGSHRGRLLSGQVATILVTPDGQHVVSGSRDTLKFWNLSDFEEVYSLNSQIERFDSIALTPDGRRIVSGSNNHTLKIRDLATGKEIFTLAESRPGDQEEQPTSTRDPVTAVVLTWDGRYAISGSEDRTLKIWDLEKRAFVTSFVAEGEINDLGFSNHLGVVVAGDATGRVHLLHLENLPLGSPIVTPFHSPDEKNCAFGCLCCCTWSEIPPDALGTAIRCPHCNEELRLNPFAIESDWRPIAQAWMHEKEED
ncbi:TIR domain-containing protein [Methanofollis formosanus]|uniref:TIR domain-containing protein n=1 Tax=Methanofollis formosanus TaxID=299308 RepID=A0A8G1A0Y3_9EURY|nr:TIR domain-containing protein [Methanofollis formosanus]QYZ78072.1 TIR domain-containing protein [Methanofollis formosanus]